MFTDLDADAYGCGMSYTAKRDQALLPLGDGGASAGILGQIKRRRIRPMQSVISSRVMYGARTHACKSADDSGSVVGQHEWEEEMLEETGGDFLLIHVRIHCPQSITSTNDRDSCLPQPHPPTDSTRTSDESSQSLL